MTQLLTLDGTPASRFAFGTMQFGGKADETASRAMFDACRGAGITHFDTAYVYTDGASETLLGKMIGAERERLLIATKAGYVDGNSAANMAAQFETSRQRLGLDVVDVLYLHHYDPAGDLRDTIEGLARLKQTGKIRYIGLSNMAAWQVMKAVFIAGQLGVRIDLLQPMYSLVKRQAEVEILPMCADQGIVAATYSPLGGGILTGKYARGEGGRLVDDKRYAKRYGQGWMGETAAALAGLAAELGTDPATLAVAWVAAHPTGPVPIVSARSAEQLAPSLAALDYDMTPELYARIAALSPTPPPATDRTEEAA
ncbi:aldo/keto reductase [Seohaeicola zhoushanensis]|uniref:Aldo/keto reductase n=1 Tax=Seohaeicola zhoushanensis TaxID=1569283 RepID=A0A8J3H1Q1_9RHOB|nr:aldo/keto reductase [Seohaeicola zhoushanensis]GHF65995.1 aldo/keto reductase [Seohaeicola zhoushanensis]